MEVREILRPGLFSVRCGGVVVGEVQRRGESFYVRLWGVPGHGPFGSLEAAAGFLARGRLRRVA